MWQCICSLRKRGIWVWHALPPSLGLGAWLVARLIKIIDASWCWYGDLRGNSHVQFVWFRKINSLFSVPTSYAQAANLKTYFVLQDPCLLRRKRRIIWRPSRSEMFRYALSTLLSINTDKLADSRTSSREFFTQTFIMLFLSTACIQTRKDYGATICGRRQNFGFWILGGKPLSNSSKSMYCDYNTLMLVLTHFSVLTHFHDGLIWHIFRLSWQWISLMVLFLGICRRFVYTSYTILGTKIT